MICAENVTLFSVNCRLFGFWAGFSTATFAACCVYSAYRMTHIRTELVRAGKMWKKHGRKHEKARLVRRLERREAPHREPVRAAVDAAA